MMDQNNFYLKEKKGKGSFYLDTEPIWGTIFIHKCIYVGVKEKHFRKQLM